MAATKHVHSSHEFLTRVVSKKDKPTNSLERIGFSAWNNLENDQRIRAGKVPVGVFRKLKSELDLNEEAVLDLIGMSHTTVSRRKTLKPDEAGKVYRFAYILSLTEEVLGGHEKGLRWLKTPSTFLGSRKPIELVQTEAGAEEVKNLIFRIEHSVYS